MSNFYKLTTGNELPNNDTKITIKDNSIKVVDNTTGKISIFTVGKFPRFKNGKRIN